MLREGGRCQIVKFLKWEQGVPSGGSGAGPGLPGGRFSVVLAFLALF